MGEYVGFRISEDPPAILSFGSFAFHASKRSSTQNHARRLFIAKKPWISFISKLSHLGDGMNRWRTGLFWLRRRLARSKGVTI